MNFHADESLVGCKVVIETSSGDLEGVVRTVAGGKVSIINGVWQSSKASLPPLYHVFIKDIVSISIIAGEVQKVNGSSKQAEKQKKTTMKLPESAESIPASRLAKRRVEPLLQAKSLPIHIQKLNNNIEVDVLTNKIPQLSVNGTKMDLNITDYVVIDTINDVFNRAIATVSNENDIGLSMEGVRIDRFGLVCWIGIAARDMVFLFDMCSLGPNGIKEGLGKVLADPDILKIIHDCRFVADALLHQYGVKIENVFDTQVAASVVDRRRSQSGKFDTFVPSLVRCLGDYLGFLKDEMFCPRTRAGYEKEDEAKWRQRPLPQHLLDGAAFNVCHLKQLRVVLVEELLREVTMGTTLYLKEVSDLTDDCVAEKHLTAHQVPTSFETLYKHFPMARNGLGSTNNRSSLPKESCDPYVSFTRHIPHVRRF